MRISIIGTGRAGTSFALALERAGHAVRLLHHDELGSIGNCEVLLLCVPDDAIAEVASQVSPSRDRLVAHVAGSHTLEVLAPHPRVGSLHPLITLPSGELGAARLLGATYCVAGDPSVLALVGSLEGRIITLSDAQRTAYHATAVVAANHLVALMGHVATLAESAGLCLEDFLPLAHQALRDVGELGPHAALTGPASRGDMATIDAHLAAIPELERSTYVAMANAAFELAEQRRAQASA
jgi:predicted short-subunit dehydrogenase-like oxidoreductase (DUF2520 family)